MNAVELAEWSWLASLGRTWYPEVRGHVAALRAELRDRADGSFERDGVGIAIDRRTWDTEFFGCPMVRIPIVEHEGVAIETIGRVAADAFERVLGSATDGYMWCEVPVGLPALVQGLCAGGFRHVETRTTWVWEVSRPPRDRTRVRVRQARPEDADDLRSVAATARNPWDRYHADPFFTTDVADGYLAAYAEACLRGMSETVLVPDAGDTAAPGAFMAVAIDRRPVCPAGNGDSCALPATIGRIPLVAVGESRRGWHQQLLAAAMERLASEGVEVGVMTTQLANRAVTTNCERLGWRLGHATHVLVRSRGRAPGSGGGRR